MPAGGFTPAQWFVLVEHELILFAGLFFLLGTLDELAVDVIWLCLRLTGRGKSIRLAESDVYRPLAGPAAVFIAAWHEAPVIGSTVAHTLRSWPHEGLRLYVGTRSS